MNLTIFINTLKRNWKLLLIFVVVLSFYFGVIVSLANPQDMTEVRELYGTMGDMLKAFSIDIEAMTTPLSYAASTFFGVLVLAFTMVFYIIQNIRAYSKNC